MGQLACANVRIIDQSKGFALHICKIQKSTLVRCHAPPCPHCQKLSNKKSVIGYWVVCTTPPNLSQCTTQRASNQDMQIIKKEKEKRRIMVNICLEHKDILLNCDRLSVAVVCEWKWCLKDKGWTNPFEYDLDFHDCQGDETPLQGQTHDVKYIGLMIIINYLPRQRPWILGFLPWMFMWHPLTPMSSIFFGNFSFKKFNPLPR